MEKAGSHHEQAIIGQGMWCLWSPPIS